MNKISIRELKKIVGGSITNTTDKDKFIDNIFFNSSKKENHGLFLPFKGANVDGHDFIEETVSKKRAIYSLSENSKKMDNVINVESVQDSLDKLATYVRENSNARIIGITGSNGKTTTKDMVSTLLSESHNVCHTTGNLNNFIGLPFSMCKLDSETKYGIFEAGISEPDEMDGLAKILAPDISIITSVSASHMEYYKDVDEIKKEKARISYYTKDLTIINGDVDGLKELCNPNIKTVSFGTSNDDDFHFNPIFTDGYLSVEYNNRTIRTNFIGVDNVSNIYATITLLIILGYSIENIQLLFGDLKPGKGRMNLIVKSEFDIIDDAYNANPESVKNLLKTINSFHVLKRKVVVLGEMTELGANSVAFHKDILALFEENVEYILKGDIYKDIIDTTKKNIKLMNTNEEICKYLKKAKLSNAVVGIKGSHSTKMFDIVNYLDEVFS